MTTQDIALALPEWLDKCCQIPGVELWSFSKILGFAWIKTPRGLVHILADATGTTISIDGSMIRVDGPADIAPAIRRALGVE